MIFSIKLSLVYLIEKHWLFKSRLVINKPSLNHRFYLSKRIKRYLHITNFNSKRGISEIHSFSKSTEKQILLVQGNG